MESLSLVLSLANVLTIDTPLRRRQAEVPVLHALQVPALGEGEKSSEHSSCIDGIF